MAETLRARGPDQGGVFVDPVNGAGLAARRLAITGHGQVGAQPMTDPAAGMTLVFNGEIYNHVALRQTLLAIEGEPFRGDSDTEVLLRALRRWGDGCLERIEGMFAFACWDAHREHMLLARDRTGQKPLLWAQTPHGLVFASDMRAIATSGWLTPRVRSQAIAEYLVMLASPEPDSMFEDTYRLEAGTCLTLTRDGRRSARRYWSAASLLHNPLETNANDLAVELGDRLGAAVATMIPSGQRWAATLSGGIDSQLIAASVTGRVTPPSMIATLGLSPPGALDEAKGASAAAARLELSSCHQLYRFTANELIEEHRILSALRLDAPVATCDSVLVSSLCARLQARDIRVCLFGDGADEIAGYPSHWCHADDPPRRFVQALYPEQAAALCRPSLARFAAGALARLDAVAQPDLAGVARIVALEIGFRLPAFMAPRIDFASMAHGVELRCPFLHEPVMELLLRAPAALKIADGIAKAPLRILHQRRFAHATPTKMGFGHPLAPFLAKWAAGRVGGAYSRVLPYLREDRLSAMVDDPRSDPFQLFVLYALEVWLETVSRYQ